MNLWEALGGYILIVRATKGQEAAEKELESMVYNGGRYALICAIFWIVLQLILPRLFPNGLF